MSWGFETTRKWIKFLKCRFHYCNYYSSELLSVRIPYRWWKFLWHYVPWHLYDIRITRVGSHSTWRGNLLAFNESSNHPSVVVELPVSFKEWRDDKTVSIWFLVISCESVYNTFLGTVFLEKLDAMVSTIHMKMKYHNNFDKRVVISADLCGGSPDTWNNTQEHFSGHCHLWK